MNKTVKEALMQWREKISEELDLVTQFWISNSHDTEHGGFITCLDADGREFDDTKYIWLQSRQVWTYARLYNEVERFSQSKEDLLNPAIAGADFLLKNCLVKRDGFSRCAFSTTVDGKPLQVKRNLFAETFFVMAMSEIFRATKKDKYKNAAIDMMKQINRWCLEDDSQLGREALLGNTPTSILAVAMMALCLCKQMKECDLSWSDDMNKLKDWSVKELLLHVQREGTTILETVSSTGEELDGWVGRTQIPGHAIECGWFLLDHADQVGDKELAQKAIKYFIERPFEQGWDKDFDGLYYFLDADKLPPTQLEWSMKLWWPHNEAMIAFLMAYRHTRDNKYIDRFQQVASYAFEKFKDDLHDGWYGYLDRRGELSTGLKGGPWKGFFHVPRCLYMCEKLIDEILE